MQMNMDMLARTNQLGALTAMVYYILVIAILTIRLLGKPLLEQRIGYLLFILALPLFYLLLKAPALQRAPLYYVQVGLLLLYLVAEALLDYVFKVDFRHVRWMTIGYVMLFFAASGGMIGVAMLAGRAWGLAGIVLFLIMASLSFIQRSITGL